MPWHSPTPVPKRVAAKSATAPKIYKPNTLVRIKAGGKYVGEKGPTNIRDGAFARVVDPEDPSKMHCELARTGEQFFCKQAECEPVADAAFNRDAGWETFDREEARRVDVGNRRAALNHLGARMSTALLAATWSRDEASALTRVFDRFASADGVVDGVNLRTALSLLHLRLDTDESTELIASFMGKGGARFLPLGAFRQLCSQLRQLEHAPRDEPPAQAPLLPGALSKDDGGPVEGGPLEGGPLESGGGAEQGQAVRLFSSDDGGPPGGANAGVPSAAADHRSRPPQQPLPAAELVAKTPSAAPAANIAAATGRGGMALTESAVGLEIDHVRRCLLGRAMRSGSTTDAIVYEHIAYHEGLERALHGQHAARELKLLKNRDVVKLRSTRGSVWRPATAGPQNRVKHSQPNINPYSSSKPAEEIKALGRTRREYVPRTQEQLNDWVAMVDHLQRKCGPK